MTGKKKELFLLRLGPLFYPQHRVSTDRLPITPVCKLPLYSRSLPRVSTGMSLLTGL